MGNKLQLPQILSGLQNPSQTHSYDELKQKIHLINSIFKQAHQKLFLHLQLTVGTIRYEQMNWKKSTVRGTVKVGKRESIGLIEDKQCQWQKDQVVLAYEDVNTIYSEIKNLQSKPKTNTSSSPNKSLISSQTSTPTPSLTPQISSLSQPEECCICLQKTPSMVLPCSVAINQQQHAFCDDCTVKYIIQADQKKCPQCRQEIKGSRQSVQKQIFTVVQDQEVFEQVRFDVLQVLRNLNPRVINNFEEFLKSK